MSKIFYRTLLDNALVTYLLNFLLISLLESRDVIGSLFGFLDFLPGFHFLLLQKSNTICQQLGVTINAKDKISKLDDQNKRQKPNKGKRCLLFSSLLHFCETLLLLVVCFIISHALVSTCVIYDFLAAFHLSTIFFITYLLIINQT